MQEFKVSILVPTFNMQKYMRQSLYSITNQSLDDIQIICINDGSTDLSTEILEEFAKNDDRIEIVSKPNTGYGNSMNLGLEAAKGEFIGIVEPDDFIDQEMFKTLYDLAKKNDAEVVKCNFYNHADNTEPSDDVYVEYLEGCDYDVVFCPRKNDAIFLTAPSTCTAIYKRSLIEDNHVRYLETPGASFQDTFFNYQILALTERMYLTKDAFHHYRINEGSSVLSPGKIFCVCKEYEAIWEHAKAHPDTYNDLKYRIPRAQYGTYFWNLERLAPRVRHEFYERFVDDFRQLSTNGLLNKDFFDEYTWDRLQEMLNDPDRYYSSNYGAIKIDTSVLVLSSSKALKSLDEITNVLSELLPKNCEVYFKTDNTNPPNNVIKPYYIDKDSRFHYLENTTSCGLICQINIDDYSGKELIVIHLHESISKKQDLSAFRKQICDVVSNNSIFMNEKIAIGAWNMGELRNLDLPIWEPLLFSNFYNNPINDKPNSVPEWLLNPSAFKAVSDLKETISINNAFIKLYEYVLTEISDKDYQFRKAYFSLFANLWKHVQAEYDHLNYDDRLQFGNKPSPMQCQALTYTNTIDNQSDMAQINVVIPVYNVEKYVAECLDSVLSQGIPSLQIICVNDASTDSSLDILEQYANEHSNISVVSQFNGGAGSARNRGIELSHSEYLAFIDPDDYYSSNKSLSNLLNAAKTNNAKICGGSVELFWPDGSIESFHGGEQFFYNMKKEGFQKFTDKETDYGWIRYIYHETIFNEGGIRFPERRWYEDPVFLTKVIDYCDEYYAIPDLVYEYRVSHKEDAWNVVKARDMVKGISENLKFAERHSLSTMYSSLIFRLNRDYYQAIMEYINDEEVFTTLAIIQGNMNLSLVNVVKENEWKSYLIKPFFDLINHKDTAIVRMARKAQNTPVYHFLQKVRSKLN